MEIITATRQDCLWKIRRA